MYKCSIMKPTYQYNKTINSNQSVLGTVKYSCYFYALKRTHIHISIHMDFNMLYVCMYVCMYFVVHKLKPKKVKRICCL